MESLRPLLTTYAYNIIGTYEDARDVVQDAYLKFMSLDRNIEDEKAYLTRMVINLSINFKNRQKKLLAQYPGEWLPEPVATDFADSQIIRKEVLSYSLMVLLEKLNAKQRAVFILREAFSYDHEQIAETLSISIENSRKLLSRAKDQIHSPAVTQQNIPKEYLEKFLHVLQTGDTVQLEQLLVNDITLTSDGGGKAVAFVKPVLGRKAVTKLLAGLFKKFYNDARLETAVINHQPALFYYENDKLVTCQILTVKDGHVTDIFFIRNPDKLRILKKDF